MAHYHHCKVCKIPVANCSDERCAATQPDGSAEETYCSIHHPDPAHHVEPTPPLSRFGPLSK